MKKIVSFGAFMALLSCSKQVEEVIIEQKVDKIIKVPAQAKSQTTIAYYFEPQSAIATDKKDNERIISIDWHNNEVFLGIEASLENNQKRYSVRLLDVATGRLTEIISNLKEIKDLTLSESHIFVTQSNTIAIFDRITHAPFTIIGSGTQGYSGDGYGLFDALALQVTDKHLFVRDLRRLLAYNRTDLTAQNSKRISAPVKSSYSQRSRASLTLIDNNLYLANGNSVEIYTLNALNSIQNEQSASKTLQLGSQVHQLTTFRGHLYASLGAGGFARIDIDKSSVGHNINTFENQALNATCLAFGTDKLFVVNDANGTIATYNVKEITYKEY